MTSLSETEEKRPFGVLSSRLPESLLWLALLIGAAVAHGEVIDDGRPLDDIAAPNLRVDLQWSRSAASAFVQGVWTARDDRPGPVETNRPSFSTVDLGFGWKFSEFAHLRVHARNVFDESYTDSADANAAPASGRSLIVSLAGIKRPWGRGHTDSLD